MCIVVTLALAAAIGQADLAPGKMAGQIMATFLLATMLGAAGGLAWSALLERVHDLDHSISTTPAFMLLVYAARVPVVRASFDAGTTREDAAVAVVMAPKGLAAAVLASVPLKAGFAGGAGPSSPSPTPRCCARSC